MGIRSWFRGWRFCDSLFRAKRPRQPDRRGPRYVQLHLEQLENRLAPAAVSWTGSAGTLNWSDANNWSNDAVPGSADDVTISKSGVGTITIGSGSYAVHSLNDTTAVLSIASSGTLSLVAVAATSTFDQNVTVQSGGTLTVGAGASVQINSSGNSSVTITDNGILSFGNNDTATSPPRSSVLCHDGTDCRQRRGAT